MIFTPDPSSWQRDFLDNFDKYRVKDDDRIDAYNCIECGGRCCTNNDVLINPYDVWRIVHTPEVSRTLGIETSHDLFTPRSEGEHPFLNYYLGPNSRLPVASINMVEVSDEFTICPLSAPVVALRNAEDRENLAKSKVEHLKFVKARYGNLARLCTLEKAKPTICRAFPLGRGALLDPKNPDWPPKMEYVRMDTSWCDQFMVPGGAMPVREYVKKWGLDEGYRMSDLFYAWQRELASRVKNEEVRYAIGLCLYDFDAPAVMVTEKAGVEGPRREEVIRLARPANFEGLLERSYRTIDAATAGHETAFAV